MHDCMLYLYFINLTYNAITDKFRCCQEGDRKRQGYQAEGQYNFVERKHIRLANKWLNFPLLRKAAIMGSATCNFSERVNVHASSRYVGVISQEMREEMMEMFKNKGNFWYCFEYLSHYMRWKLSSNEKWYSDISSRKTNV